MEIIQINILERYLTGRDRGLRVYIYLTKDRSFNYGDIIRAEGEIKLPSKARNDKGSDYSITNTTPRTDGKYDLTLAYKTSGSLFAKLRIVNKEFFIVSKPASAILDTLFLS